MIVLHPHKKLVTTSFVEKRYRKLFGFKLWSYWQTLYRVEKEITLRTFDGQDVTIEEGYITDYGTIPWLFRWIYPQSREYNLSCAGHDKLYTSQIGNRLYADINFLCWMYMDKVSKRTMLIFFFVVALGGQKQWSKYTLK
ncbi:MAG: DUF1353 domain-containing protein [bacterium]|jgi:hypothetical protein